MVRSADMPDRLLLFLFFASASTGCGSDAAATFDAMGSPSIDAAVTVDAPPPDARSPDARVSAFPPIPGDAVDCSGTFAVNAACNTNRSDYLCRESAFGAEGWVRQDVVNLDCPNGTAAALCGGSPTQPFYVSVIRLCRTGGADQSAPCPDGMARPTGPAGCAVCETTNLTCL
jgi:hypothetical protein